jgi:Lrp/AsnC family transcriptional regulator for asnA, asnC and gidA
MVKRFSSVSVDAIDRLIIDQLRIDGRQSFALVGEKIGLSEPTVRSRYNRLVKLGVMQVVGMQSQTKAGEIYVLGFLSVIHNDVDQVCESLYQVPEVTYIAQCIGEFDLCIDFRCLDEEHVSKTKLTLQNIPGVAKYEFHKVTEVSRERYLWEGLTS